VEDRWEKLEQIFRRVLGQELDARGIKSKTKLGFLNGQWIGITAEQLSAWKAAYGAVDVEMELRKASAWIVSNPHLAPKSNFARFMNSWLARQQNVSSIRSIPTQSNAPEKKKCSYCDRPATSSPNRTPACDEHFNDAMYHKKLSA
jgi:hypothetical protein